MHALDYPFTPIIDCSWTMLDDPAPYSWHSSQCTVRDARCDSRGAQSDLPLVPSSATEFRGKSAGSQPYVAHKSVLPAPVTRRTQ